MRRDLMFFEANQQGKTFCRDRKRESKLVTRTFYLDDVASRPGSAPLPGRPLSRDAWVMSQEETLEYYSFSLPCVTTNARPHVLTSQDTQLEDLSLLAISTKCALRIRCEFHVQSRSIAQRKHLIIYFKEASGDL